MRNLSTSFMFSAKSDSDHKASEPRLCKSHAIRTDLMLIHFIFGWSHLPLLELGFLLRFDFRANGKSFV
jgi:hypothetical protein